MDSTRHIVMRRGIDIHPQSNANAAGVYADWLEERGFTEAAEALRKGFPDPAEADGISLRVSVPESLGLSQESVRAALRVASRALRELLQGNKSRPSPKPISLKEYMASAPPEVRNAWRNAERIEREMSGIVRGQ